jgi:hypothetical protein
MDPRQFDDLVKRLARGASRRNVLKGFAGGIAGVFSGGLAAKRTANAAPAGKVTICHFTSSDTNPYEIITISSNALSQHQTNHGDNLFGDCCLDSDCSVPDGTQCAVAVCRVDDTGTSYCDLDPTPGAVCDDGIECTVDDVCGAAVNECAGTPVNSLCDDGNACTTDTCEVGVGCTYADVNCDDGNACTNDSCDPASGCVYTDVVCDDDNACTTDSCDPASGCVHTDVICPDDDDPCTVTRCDRATGCVNEPVVCPPGEVCFGGVCQATCPDGGSCASGFSPCGDDPDCFCFAAVGGLNLCIFPRSCSAVVSCDSHDDCPAGEFCLTNDCCGGTCGLACEDRPTGFAAFDASDGAGGPTQAGGS